jgi:hypothetical protein
VHREQRHLDRERDGERQEDPPGRRPVERARALGVVDDGVVLGDLDQVEAERLARLQLGDALLLARVGVALGLLDDLLGLGPVLVLDRVAVQEGEGDDPDQHQGRAEQREEEELQRRVDPVGVAPPPDEEVHRHQHDLEHHEEQEEVERDEHAEAAGLEQQQPGVVGLGVVVGRGPQQGDREQQRGQHHQEQRDAVDTHVPRDAELGHPRPVDLELVAGVAPVEGAQHVDRQRPCSHREQHGHAPQQLGPGPGHQQHSQRAERRHQHQRGEDGEVGRVH